MGKEVVSAEDLHQALETEIRKMRTGADWAKWLDAAALFPSFGFGNVVLINLQMPHANWVANAGMWEKLGRQVVGRNAIRILKPVHSRTSPADNGPTVDGQVHQQVIGFRVATVYDVTDTVGRPLELPSTPAPHSRRVPVGLWDALTREVYADGFALEVRPSGNGSDGYTDYKAKQIVLGDHLDDYTAVARLAHEVGHMRLHSATGTGATPDETRRGVREVEAESVAYIVLAHHGVGTEASSFDYVAGWAALVDPDDPGSVIKATGARVVNAARDLIESTNKHLKTNRTPLPPVAARPLDSLFLPPDAPGPAL
ncbi:hypothetical protein AB0H36_05255 [Kribbella sp. NPDC050820]|uniref:hypothetical protein n=1 Tax=Kribbella sp. NPDC050820 TaxID=3155408 RepID=UPI0033EB1C66